MTKPATFWMFLYLSLLATTTIMPTQVLADNLFSKIQTMLNQKNNGQAVAQGGTQLETNQNNAPLYFRSRKKKTYLINGLASSIESIGYGFTNLSRKIPGSSLHNYASFIESSTVIRSRITREIKSAYRQDPNVEINLIGISFGANIVTLIATDLDLARIPVNYIATLEGPAMVPIRKNVRIADSFSCTNLDCFRTRSRLAFGNKVTKFRTFKVNSSHIPLADHPSVHTRIVSQINALPPSAYSAQ